MQVEAVQGLVSKEATSLHARIMNVDSNISKLGDKMDQFKEEIVRLVLTPKGASKELDSTKDAMQASTATFQNLFVWAPIYTPEEWMELHGKDAKDADEEERSEVGWGSFGSTHRVRGRAGGGGSGVKEGQLFAAKLLQKKDLRRRGMGKADVEKEIWAHDRLRHVHIIRFFRMFEGPDAFFIVMEFAEGGTLAARIGADLSLPDMWLWTLQLVKVLAYIHEQGLAHCDLKPENIFMSKEGNIKVGDFGLATDVGASIQVARAMDAVGTKIYFSPELGIKGVKGSVRANDVWALGCLLVEMVQRKRLESALYPPEMASTRSMLIKIAQTADLALGAVAEHSLVVECCMRFTADQLIRLLEPLLPAAPPLPPAAPPQVSCKPLFLSIDPKLSLQLTFV